MQIQELRKRVRFWKRELGLHDWKIRIRQAKPGEIPDAHATVQRRGDFGQAEIVIHLGSKFDEYFLLHELAHVVLDGMTTEQGEAAASIEERAVNRFTHALARAHGIPCPGWDGING